MRGKQAKKERRQAAFTFGSTLDGTGAPAVFCEWGDLTGTMTPAQAKSVGLGLMAAAVEAESDAALYAFLVDRAGFDALKARQFVAGVFAYRSHARGGSHSVAADGSAVQEEAERPRVLVASAGAVV